MYKIVGGLSIVVVLIGIGVWWMMTGGIYQVPTGRELIPHVDEAAYQDISEQSETPLASWVFVPYWADISTGFAHENIDHLMYFGLLVDEKGVVYKDEGYAGVETFLSVAQSSPASRWLTIRMVDSTSSIRILSNEDIWESMIRDIATIAHKYAFDGVVLDLEVGFPLLVRLQDSITTFSQMMAHEVKEHDLLFAQAIYGDVFYRKRPYDVTQLGIHSDYILVMAYDYHKSYGNPGPNFPLERGDIYMYDFKTMVADYDNHVPATKLVYIFGMFGYDWPVNAEGKARTMAQALSLHQIRDRFIDICVFTSCAWERDPLTHEIKVQYRDETGENHVVWGEDEESVTHKRNVLKQYGIHNIGYWAWGYY